jgi:hypothetical protein
LNDSPRLYRRQPFGRFGLPGECVVTTEYPNAADADGLPNRHAAGNERYACLSCAMVLSPDGLL